MKINEFLKQSEPKKAHETDSEAVFEDSKVTDSKDDFNYSEEPCETNHNKQSKYPIGKDLSCLPNKETLSHFPKFKELDLSRLEVMSIKIYIEAVCTLVNKSNSLGYLKIKCFEKLREEYRFQVTEKEAKSFRLSFHDKELGLEVDKMNFETLAQNAILNSKALNSDDISYQIQFKLICNDLEIESKLIRSTLLKREQEMNSFAMLVRIFDKTGKPCNAFAAISNHGGTPALTIKSIQGETKISMDLGEKFTLGELILDKARNLVGVQFISEKGEKSERLTGPLVFVQNMQEVDMLLKTVNSYSSQKNILHSKSINLQQNSLNRELSNENLNYIFEDKGFEVVSYGYLRIKHERIIKFSPCYELSIYKRTSDQEDKFEFSIPLGEIQEIKPKVVGSRKYLISFKDQKRYSNLKLRFKNPDDEEKFTQFFYKLIERAEKSRSAILRENCRKQGKNYSWLSGPTTKRKTYSSDGKIESYSFNIINLSEKESQMTLKIDFVRQTLSLYYMNEEICTTIAACRIKNFETELEECLAETISFVGDYRMKLLFTDNKDRYIFRSAIGSLKIPSKFFSKSNELFETHKLFITTFNVGSAEPPELKLWLQKALECDIIVIGLQETDPEAWLQKIEAYLSKANLELISLNMMWKMCICVYVRTQLREFISNVETVNKATGIGNVLGNKGGVGVGMKIKETSFCFISCHLAAKPGRIASRKADFYDIMKYVRPCCKEFEPTATFDYFFLIGDTNFRIDYPFEKTLQAINNGELEKLKQYDELLREQNANNEFACFYEPEINFKPTYRRIREKNDYSNKKNQSPSWTDRILCRGKPGRQLKVLEYNSCESFFCSDHRPVYSIIEINIEPHYKFLPPLYTLPVVPNAEIIFNKLTLDYDFEKALELEEISLEYLFPMQIYIAFFGKFLNNYPNTAPINFTDLLIWNSNKIPAVHCVVADVNYLKNQFLDLIVYVRSNRKDDILVGYACLSLKSIENLGHDKLCQFSIPVHFYAKNFGHINGEFSFKSVE